MTIRHLKVFIEVCERGGITKAAESLHIAQPAVSQTVSDIEKYYNVRLFERINQRLVLTEPGKELLLKAKEAVAAFDEFGRFASSAAAAPTVRIGTSLTIGKIFLPGILSGIRAGWPQVKPWALVDKTGAIEGAIVAGELDFGIVEGEVKSPNLRRVPFATDRLIAVCGPGLDVPPEIALEELTAYDLLLRESGSASRNFLDNLFSSRGLTAAPLMQSSDNQAILAAAANNLGVAVLPEGLAEPWLRAGRLKELIVRGADFVRCSSLISHKNKRFPGPQREIYEYCRQYAATRGTSGVSNVSGTSGVPDDRADDWCEEDSGLR